MTKRLKQGKKLAQGVLVGLAGTFVALALWGFGLIDPFEAKTWDWRAALLAEPGMATDDIRVIFLDQNSLDWAKKESGLTWPWPREVYGAIVDYCGRSGAKALAFDVLYTEPSKYGVADDVAFGSSAAAFGRFVGAVFLGEKTGSSTTWPKNLNTPGLKVTGLDDWMQQNGSGRISFPRATFPIPELSEKSAVLSNVQLEPDPDGIYRRTKLIGVFDGKVLPPLGLGAYMAAEPDVRSAISPGKLTIGNFHAPIDRSGSAVLRYRGPSGTHKNYSAAAVLQSEIRIRSGEAPTITDKNAFKGKYVFFGFSAPGLFDLRPSPVDGVYPGVEIHATMLDNFLSGDFIRTTPVWITILIVLVLAVTCSVLMTFFSNTAGSVTFSAIFLVIPILVSLFAYGKGIWLNLAVQEMALVSAIALALIVNYATEGRQKRFIKNAFQQYLSPAVIDQLIQHPERLKLGGERRVLSIFFSDLQGFTSISESLDPESLTALLNDYLSAMADIIIEEGGTIDKYEGDAIIAFWNAPVEVADHAVRIVRATLRCQKKLAEMRPEFKERIGKDMLMRVGINTGPAVVGNMGSHERFDYTMMGDSVNLAARLEGVNKQFGTYTMISEYTRDMMADAYPLRELARVAVVGKKEPVTVYEPMYPEEYKERKEILEVFSKGLALFYQGRFEEAGRILSEIESRDPAAAAYRKKCDELKESPPENWAGVWVMSTK
jgi:adenylate cyclase